MRPSPGRDTNEASFAGGAGAGGAAAAGGTAGAGVGAAAGACFDAGGGDGLAAAAGGLAVGGVAGAVRVAAGTRGGGFVGAGAGFGGRTVDPPRLPGRPRGLRRRRSSWIFSSSARRSRRLAISICSDVDQS